jgi:acyl dehydratase
MLTLFRKKWTVRFADITKFTEVVGDYNAVHRDAEFAAKTRFKTPIAHGMTAIVMLNHLLPSNQTIKEFQIKFIKPIYPEDELTAQLSISQGQEFELRLSKEDQTITVVKGLIEKLS